MKKSLFFTIVLLLLHSVFFGQCPYTGTPLTQAGIITFCIDNTNTQTVNTNAGQYVLVNVIQGYNYTFSVPNISGFAGNENLTIYDALNTSTSLANSTGVSGTSITWTATLSGQIKIILSKGACVNDSTAGGAMTLKLNTIGDTSTYVSDLDTAAGTNSWVGHVYNTAGGGTPEPFTSANYAGYYLESTPAFSQAFGSNTSCFAVNSNGVARASIYTEGFAVRYKMTNTAMTGCYMIKVNGDDGVRLSINGTSVFNAWREQAPTIYDNVLVNLSSGDQLVLDYYENGGQNTVSISFTPFSSATNTITPVATTVCSGGATQLLTGSAYPITATQISGTNIAYQWQKGSAAGGPFTDISGATAQNYTPPAISTSTPQTDYYVRVVKPTSSLTTSCSTSNTAAITTTGVLATVGTTQNNCISLISGSLGGNVPAAGSTGTWSKLSGPGTVVFSTPITAISTAKVSVVGTYVFRWKVTISSCSNFADVTVNYGVTPTVNTPPATLCVGNTFQLTPSIGGTWSSSNAAVASVNATGLITGISGGTGVTFTFTSSLAGSCTAATSPVTIPNLPSVSHDNTSLTVCQGYSQGVLTSATTGGLFPFTYQWFLNGGAISSAITNTYTPGVLSTSGTYSYNVVVTDACSKIASSIAKVITVLDDPFPPTATMSPATTTVCAGTSLTLINPVLGSGGTGTQNFEYSTTSATAGFLSTVPTITAVAGTNTIWIRTNPSGSGCNNSTATAYTWIGTAKPTAAITGGGKICLPSTFPTVSIALTGTSPWNITYTNGTPVTVAGITTNPYTFTPLTAGNYTVTAISDANCTGTFSGSAIVILDTTNPIIACPITQNISGCSTAAITGNTFSTLAISISTAQFVSAGGSSSDDCAVTNITYQDSALGTCPIVVTRAWKVFDAAGNVSSCNQIINIQDTTKPVLAGQGANFTSCSSAYSFTAPTASDNCDSAPIISFVDTSSLGTNPNANNYTRTWTAKDSCGNASLTVSQTVLVQIMVTPIVTVVNNCGMGTSTLSTNALGGLLWSTGETTSSITVSTAGSYTVKSTLNGCVSALGTGVATPLLAPIIP